MKSDSPRRFAVFSDVHGNLPALRTLLSELDSNGYDQSFCCGDIVGYGANPNECCGLLRERGIPVVLGNHDYAAFSPDAAENFNKVARSAALWTQKTLTKENERFLRDLPLTMSSGDFSFVHSSPLEPNAWNYILTPSQASRAFKHFDGWMCFIGHSHQPFVAVLEEDGLTCTDLTEIELRRDSRYVVNVGSVGHPRDEDSRLCYVSVDIDDGMLRYHRAEYPVDESQEAIIQADLPSELAMRLSWGW
jgi:diadenosine tetraphosphatase ApaH/serine/threonine PP2A family protein phosphatase